MWCVLRADNPKGAHWRLARRARPGREGRAASQRARDGCGKREPGGERGGGWRARVGGPVRLVRRRLGPADELDARHHSVAEGGRLQQPPPTLPHCDGRAERRVQSGALHCPPPHTFRGTTQQKRLRAVDIQFST